MLGYYFHPFSKIIGNQPHRTKIKSHSTTRSIKDRKEGVLSSDYPTPGSPGCPFRAFSSDRLCSDPRRSSTPMQWQMADLFELRWNDEQRLKSSKFYLGSLISIYTTLETQCFFWCKPPSDPCLCIEMGTGMHVFHLSTVSVNIFR